MPAKQAACCLNALMRNLGPVNAEAQRLAEDKAEKKNWKL